MGGNICASNTADTVNQVEELQSTQSKNIEQITLYWNLGDANSRSIRAFLQNSKQNVQFVSVDLLSNENYDPEILKLNPSGSIPFVVIEDETFVESNAILRMLCRICPEFESMYPEDAFHKASVDQILDFETSSFSLAIKTVMNTFDQIRRQRDDG